MRGHDEQTTHMFSYLLDCFYVRFLSEIGAASAGLHV